jgi:hypothetical protein
MFEQTADEFGSWLTSGRSDPGPRSWQARVGAKGTKCNMKMGDRRSGVMV